MKGLSGRHEMASISSSRRAVSRASGVPVARADISLPSILPGLASVSTIGICGFFFVAMLLFPHAPATKQTGMFTVQRQNRQAPGTSKGQKRRIIFQFRQETIRYGP